MERDNYVTSKSPTQNSVVDYSKNVRGLFNKFRDPQELSGGPIMLPKRSFSTTEKFIFSWPSNRPRKKPQRKKPTTPSTEETNNPSTIESKKYKKKNRVTTISGDVHSTTHPKKTTTLEEVESSTTVDEYTGISWKKFNWNSEHTSINTQKEKHTTQHGTRKTSSTRKYKTEMDVDQDSSDYELTQSEVEYQSEEMASKEYADYYSSETDTGNIEPNQDLNENPTATESSELDYTSQGDMMNIEPTYQQNEEPTSFESFSNSEVLNGEEDFSENPYSVGEAFLTLGNNEQPSETSQVMSGEDINQDAVTASDEYIENPVEQKPKSELTGLDSQQKKKLFELADELLKDFNTSTVSEEKSTVKFDYETPKIVEETAKAEYEKVSPLSAENDYGNSQNPNEGSSMQPEETEEISDESKGRSSSKSEVTELETTEILKKVISQYMTEIIPETVSDVWQFNWGEGYNATEENGMAAPSEVTIVAAMVTPESPEEEEQMEMLKANTELEEVTFTPRDLMATENGNEESPSVTEENEDIAFGRLEKITVIYDENEEEMSSPKVGDEFDISGELETEVPESELTVKNTGVFSVLAENNTVSTKSSLSEESMTQGENNTSEMNAETTSKGFSSLKPSTAKYLKTMRTKTLESEELESNKEMIPKTEKMKKHTEEPNVSTASETGSTEILRETEEVSVTSGKTTNTIGKSEELASRSKATKNVEVTDYDENDAEFTPTSALQEYQKYEPEISTSEGISNGPSTIKHVKSTTTVEKISEQTEISVGRSTKIKEADEEATEELASHTHRKLGSTELITLGNIITLVSESSSSETGETETSGPSKTPSTKETNEESSLTGPQSQKTHTTHSEKTTEFSETLTHSEIEITTETIAPVEPSTQETPERTEKEMFSMEVEITSEEMPSVLQTSEEGETKQFSLMESESSTISLASTETTGEASIITHTKESATHSTISTSVPTITEEEVSTEVQSSITRFEVRGSESTEEFSESSTLSVSTRAAATSTHIPTNETLSSTVSSEEITVASKEPIEFTESLATVHEVGTEVEVSTSQISTGFNEATVQATKMSDMELSSFSEATETLLIESTLSSEIVATSTEASEETTSNIQVPIKVTTNETSHEMSSFYVSPVTPEGSEFTEESIEATGSEAPLTHKAASLTAISEVSGTLIAEELETKLEVTHFLPHEMLSDLMPTETESISTIEDTSSWITISSEKISGTSEEIPSNQQVVHVSTVTLEEVESTEQSIDLTESGPPPTETSSLVTTETELILSTEQFMNTADNKTTETTILEEASTIIPSAISMETSEEFPSNNTPVIAQMTTVVAATASEKYIGSHEMSSLIIPGETKSIEELTGITESKKSQIETLTHEATSLTSVSSVLVSEELEATVEVTHNFSEISSSFMSAEMESISSTEATEKFMKVSESETTKREASSLITLTISTELSEEISSRAPIVVKMPTVVKATATGRYIPPHEMSSVRESPVTSEEEERTEVIKGKTKPTKTFNLEVTSSTSHVLGPEELRTTVGIIVPMPTVIEATASEKYIPPHEMSSSVIPEETKLAEESMKESKLSSTETSTHEAKSLTFTSEVSSTLVLEGLETTVEETHVLPTEISPIFLSTVTESVPLTGAEEKSVKVAESETMEHTTVYETSSRISSTSLTELYEEISSSTPVFVEMPTVVDANASEIYFPPHEVSSLYASSEESTEFTKESVTNSRTPHTETSTLTPEKIETTVEEAYVSPYKTSPIPMSKSMSPTEAAKEEVIEVGTTQNRTTYEEASWFSPVISTEPSVETPLNTPRAAQMPTVVKVSASEIYFPPHEISSSHVTTILELAESTQQSIEAVNETESILSTSTKEENVIEGETTKNPFLKETSVSSQTSEKVPSTITEISKGIEMSTQIFPEHSEIVEVSPETSEETVMRDTEIAVPHDVHTSTETEIKGMQEKSSINETLFSIVPSLSAEKVSSTPLSITGKKVEISANTSTTSEVTYVPTIGMFSFPVGALTKSEEIWSHVSGLSSTELSATESQISTTETKSETEVTFKGPAEITANDHTENLFHRTSSLTTSNVPEKLEESTSQAHLSSKSGYHKPSEVETFSKITYEPHEVSSIVPSEPEEAEATLLFQFTVHDKTDLLSTEVTYVPTIEMFSFPVGALTKSEETWSQVSGQSSTELLMTEGQISTTETKSETEVTFKGPTEITANEHTENISNGTSWLTTSNVLETLKETASQAHLSSENGYQKPTEVETFSKITYEQHEVSSVVPSESEEAEATPLFQFTVHDETHLLSTGVESLTTPSISVESTNTEISSTKEISSLEEYKNTEVTLGQVESLTTSTTLPESSSGTGSSTQMATKLPGEVETIFTANKAWTVSESLSASTTEIEEVKTTTNVTSSGTSSFVSLIETPEIETTMLFQPKKYEETEMVSQTESQSTSPVVEVETTSVMTHISPFETSSLLLSTITLETTEASLPFPSKETETEVTSPHEALTLTFELTEVSLETESQSALTKEMGHEVSEEAIATTEKRNFTTEINIHPSEEVEATTETLPVSTEATQAIGKQMPKEFKETPRIPYTPIHERPSSVTPEVTGETGWSPITRFLPISEVSESEILIQQLSTEMSEGTDIYVVSTTESNIQIHTETSKFEREQNVSVRTETPSLAITEKEGLLANVSIGGSWESVKVEPNTGGIPTGLTVVSTEPTEALEVTATKMNVINESSSRFEEINPSSESTNMSQITSLMLTEVKITTELTYLSEATLNGTSTSETIQTSKGIGKTSAEPEATKHEEYEQPTNISEHEIATYNNPTFQFHFPSSDIVTLSTSEAERVTTQRTMKTSETNITDVVTQEVTSSSASETLSASPQSTSSTSSQETEGLRKPLEEFNTSEKIHETTSEVITPSAQSTEIALSRIDRTSEATSASAILQEKASSFGRTALQDKENNQSVTGEPSEEALEEFAFTKVLEKSTLCETCSEETTTEELKQKYTMPGTTELEEAVETISQDEDVERKLIRYTTIHLKKTTKSESKSKTKETEILEQTTKNIPLKPAEPTSQTRTAEKSTQSGFKTEKVIQASESEKMHEKGTEVEGTTEISYEKSENVQTPGLQTTEMESESTGTAETIEVAETSRSVITELIEETGISEQEMGSSIEPLTEEVTSGIPEESTEVLSSSEYPETQGSRVTSEENSVTTETEVESTVEYEENTKGTSVPTSEETDQAQATAEQIGLSELSTLPDETTKQTEEMFGHSLEEGAETLELETGSIVEHEGEVTEASKTTIGETEGPETSSYLEETAKLDQFPESTETLELEVESTVKRGEVTEASESTIGNSAGTETTSHLEKLERTSELGHSLEEGSETSRIEVEATIKHEEDYTESVIGTGTTSHSEKSTETSKMEAENEGKVAEVSASGKPQEISEQSSFIEESTRASDLEEEITIKHENNVTEELEESTESTEIESTPSSEESEETSVEAKSTVKHEEVIEVSESILEKSAGTTTTSQSEETAEMGHSSKGSSETSEQMESTSRHEGEVTEASELTIAESTETSKIEVEHGTKITEASASEKPQGISEQRSSIEEGTSAPGLEEGTIKHGKNVTEVSETAIEESSEIESTPSSEESDETSIEEGAETIELEVGSTVKHEEVIEVSESITKKGTVTETTSHSEETSELGHSSKASAETSELEMESTVRHEGKVTTSHSEETSELGYSSDRAGETSELEIKPTIKHEGEVTEGSEITIKESTEIKVEKEGKLTETSASERPQEISELSSSVEESSRPSDLEEETTTQHKKIITEVSESVIEESTEIESTPSSEESDETSVEGGTETIELEVESTAKYEGVTEESESMIEKGARTETTSHSEEMSEFGYSSERSAETSKLEIKPTIKHGGEVTEASEITTKESTETSEIEVEQEGTDTETSSSERPQEISELSSSIEEGPRPSDIEEETTSQHEKNVTEVSESVIEESTKIESTPSSEESEETSVELKVESTSKYEGVTEASESMIEKGARTETISHSEEISELGYSSERSAVTSEQEMKPTIKHEGQVTEASEITTKESTETSETEVEPEEKFTEKSASERPQEISELSSSIEEGPRPSAIEEETTTQHEKNVTEVSESVIEESTEIESTPSSEESEETSFEGGTETIELEVESTAKYEVVTEASESMIEKGARTETTSHSEETSEFVYSSETSAETSKLQIKPTIKHGGEVTEASEITTKESTETSEIEVEQKGTVTETSASKRPQEISELSSSIEEGPRPSDKNVTEVSETVIEESTEIESTPSSEKSEETSVGGAETVELEIKSTVHEEEIPETSETSEMKVESTIRHEGRVTETSVSELQTTLKHEEEIMESSETSQTAIEESSPSSEESSETSVEGSAETVELEIKSSVHEEEIPETSELPIEASSKTFEMEVESTVRHEGRVTETSASELESTLKHEEEIMASSETSQTAIDESTPSSEESTETSVEGGAETVELEIKSTVHEEGIPETSELPIEVSSESFEMEVESTTRHEGRVTETSVSELETTLKQEEEIMEYSEKLQETSVGEGVGSTELGIESTVNHKERVTEASESTIGENVGSEASSPSEGISELTIEHEEEVGKATALSIEESSESSEAEVESATHEAGVTVISGTEKQQEDTRASELEVETTIKHEEEVSQTLVEENTEIGAETSKLEIETTVKHEEVGSEATESETGESAETETQSILEETSGSEIESTIKYEEETSTDTSEIELGSTAKHEGEVIDVTKTSGINISESHIAGGAETEVKTVPEKLEVTKTPITTVSGSIINSTSTSALTVKTIQQENAKEVPDMTLSGQALTETNVFNGKKIETTTVETKYTESLEEVNDSQLFHFSRTEISGTLCEECSGSEISTEGVEVGGTNHFPQGLSELLIEGVKTEVTLYSQKLEEISGLEAETTLQHKEVTEASESEETSESHLSAGGVITSESVKETTIEQEEVTTASVIESVQTSESKVESTVTHKGEVTKVSEFSTKESSSTETTSYSQNSEETSESGHSVEGNETSKLKVGTIVEQEVTEVSKTSIEEGSESKETPHSEIPEEIYVSGHYVEGTETSELNIEFTTEEEESESLFEGDIGAKTTSHSEKPKETSQSSHSIEGEFATSELEESTVGPEVTKASSLSTEKGAETSELEEESTTVSKEVMEEGEATEETEKESGPSIEEGAESSEIEKEFTTEQNKVTEEPESRFNEGTESEATPRSEKIESGQSVEEESETSKIEVETPSETSELENKTVGEHKGETTKVSESSIESVAVTEVTSHSQISKASEGNNTSELKEETTVEEEVTVISEPSIEEGPGSKETPHSETSEETPVSRYSVEEGTETSEVNIELTTEEEESESVFAGDTEPEDTSERTEETSESGHSAEEAFATSELEVESTVGSEEVAKASVSTTEEGAETEMTENTSESGLSIEKGVETSEKEMESTSEQNKISMESESLFNESTEAEASPRSETIEETSESGHSVEEEYETSEIEAESSVGHEEVTKALASSVEEGAETSEPENETVVEHKGEVTKVSKSSIEIVAKTEVTSHSEKTTESGHSVEGAKTSELKKVETSVEQEVTAISAPTTEGPEIKENPHSEIPEETYASGHYVEEGAETSKLKVESTVKSAIEIEEDNITEAAPHFSEKSESSHLFVEEGAESSEPTVEYTLKHKGESTVSSKSSFGGYDTELIYDTGQSVEGTRTSEVEVKSTVRHEEEVTKTPTSATEEGAEPQESSHPEKSENTSESSILEYTEISEQIISYPSITSESVEIKTHPAEKSEGTQLVTSIVGAENITEEYTAEESTAKKRGSTVEISGAKITTEVSSEKVQSETISELKETETGRVSSHTTLRTSQTTEKVVIEKEEQEGATSISSISSVENVTREVGNTISLHTSVGEEIIQGTTLKNITLSSKPAHSATPEEEKEKTEQSGITSALTVKFEIKNVSHPTTYMSSIITESTEEVAEGQLFHFSKTPEGSTLCQECLNVTEKSTVSHEGSTTHEVSTKHRTNEKEEVGTSKIASLPKTETEASVETTIKVTTQTKSTESETEEIVETTEESPEHTKQTEALSPSSTVKEETITNVNINKVSEGTTSALTNLEEEIEGSTITIGERTHSTRVHAEESHSTQPILKSTEESSTHISEKPKHTTKPHPTDHHKTGITAKTKPEDFLQTLTELSGPHITSTAEEYSPTESSEDAEVLTELGVQDEKFVLKTAIENVTEESHPTPSFKTVIHGASTHRAHIGSSPTKPVVVIVNNSGKKIEKINETALQKLLNRSISEVNLEYIDLYNISKEHEGSANKSEGSEIAQPPVLKGDGKVCHRSEFESNHACVCDVDTYLKSIEHKLGDNLKVDIKHYNCSHLVSFHDGIVISNATKPVERRKRSLMYLSNKDRSSNVIENNDIEEVFGADYELQTLDSNILALPGTKALLYCHNRAYALLGNEGVTYSWEFNGDASKSGEILPTNENPLIIHNVEVKNEGNYTCIKTEEGGKKERYEHELEVVTLPIYKIQTTIFYSVNDTCSLSDGDLLYSYLPKIMGPILCGGSGKLCTVDVARPRCFTKNDDNYFNVTITATMNDVGSIFPGLAESKCSSTNCKLKAYTNVVGLVNKNAEIVKKLPVFSKINPHLEFLTNVSFSGGKAESSKPPKIITTCTGGYGIEKFKQRICVVCPKHTYSGDDEAFCKICPAGQYQPQAGSKACLPCSSPVDDSMCLRMLYTDTKLFKIYVGVAFGLVLLMIFIIIFWNSSTKRYPKRQFEGSLKHHRAMRRRNVADIEKQDLEPLLKKDNENRRNSPPEVPPPDF